MDPGSTGGRVRCWGSPSATRWARRSSSDAGGESPAAAGVRVALAGTPARDHDRRHGHGPGADDELAARDGFDADDLVARHLAWFRTEPPDIGNLTRRVLRAVADERRRRPGPCAAAAHQAGDLGATGAGGLAGNGSVMYCAPLGAAYANRPAMLFELAPSLSSLTHHDRRCRTACLAVTLTVRRVDPGRTRTQRRRRGARGGPGSRGGRGAGVPRRRSRRLTPGRRARSGVLPLRRRSGTAGAAPRRSVRQELRAVVASVATPTRTAQWPAR